jgi:hypothetical protein
MEDNKQKPEQQAGQAIDGMTAYRFRKDLHDKVYEYLNTRPYAETDVIIAECFEKVPYEEIYLTEDGLAQIVK